MAKVALTGIKPTGTPHLGNYLGMIKPALELAQSLPIFAKPLLSKIRNKIGIE